MIDRSTLLNDIFDCLRAFPAARGTELLPTTKLLSELDLDSLEILDFVAQLKVKHGVDLMALPDGLVNLATPDTVADAILAHRPSADPS